MDVRGVDTKRRGRGIDFMPDQCRELDHSHLCIKIPTTYIYHFDIFIQYAISHRPHNIQGTKKTRLHIQVSRHART